MQVTIRVVGEGAQIKTFEDGQKLADVFQRTGWVVRCQGQEIDNPSTFTLSDGLVFEASPRVKAA